MRSRPIRDLLLLSPRPSLRPKVRFPGRFRGQCRFLRRCLQVRSSRCLQETWRWLLHRSSSASLLSIRVGSTRQLRFRQRCHCCLVEQLTIRDQADRQFRCPCYRVRCLSEIFRLRHSVEAEQRRSRPVPFHRRFSRSLILRLLTDRRCWPAVERLRSQALLYRIVLVPAPALHSLKAEAELAASASLRYARFPNCLCHG